MLQQLKLDWKLHQNVAWTILGMLCLSYAVGLLGLDWIAAEDEAGFIGTLMMLMFFLLLFPLLNCMAFSSEFRLALSMGRTRRELLGAAFLRYLFLALLCSLLIRAGSALEFRLHAPVSQFFLLVDWKVLLGLVLALPVLTLFVGVLLARFGKRAGYVLYFLWLASIFFLPRLAFLAVDPEPEDPGFLDQAARLLLRQLQ